MIDITAIATETILLEEVGPSARPGWIEPKGRKLAHSARNPLLAWETMPHVGVQSWRLRDVVLDADSMLLLQGGRVIRQSNYHRPAEELAAMHLNPALLVPIEGAAPVLVCGDAWATNHYHFLNHTLPAIDANLARFGPAGLRLAAHWMRPVHEDALRMLGHDAAPMIRLEAGRQYAIGEALFCAFTVGAADFANSRLIQEIHRRLAACVPDDGRHDGRLYVSRRNDTHRRAAGEDALIAGLRRRGFTIVTPAGMKLREQIAIFRRARLVVGPHGAGLANIGFCRPGTRLYEFMPEHFIDSSILNLAIRADMPCWIDAFPGDAGSTDHTRDWRLDVPAILARVDEIDARWRWW